MEDLKLIIAKNIIDLRKKNKLTQAELAEKLNYSDKAVSKWERGASVPDVIVLKEIAELFNVSVDYLLVKDHTENPVKSEEDSTRSLRNKGVITGMSMLLVWLVAAIAFFFINLVDTKPIYQLMPFLYAVPITFVVWLIFNSLWFNKRRNFIIISLLVWTILLSLHLSFLVFGYNIWLIYILGIPGQAIIIMWSRLKL